MANVKTFMFFIVFFLSFNTLIGYFAVSSTSFTGLSLPELSENPSLLNYLSIIGEYIILFFEIALMTITNVPAWLTFFVLAIDAGFVYLLLALIRGN
jgi:hypothetical protein